MVVLAGTVSSPATAAPGDLTHVGGQGPDPSTCGTGTTIGTNYTGTGGYQEATYNLHGGIGGLAAGAGRLFVAARGHIRDANGIVAGGGTTRADDASGSPATSVSLGSITGLATNPQGTTLWVVEGAPGRLRRIDLGASGTPIWTIAGEGQLVGNARNGALADSVALENPNGVAVDAAGNVYVSELSGLLKIDPSRRVTTLAVVTSPTAIAVDATGSHVFVTDQTTVYRLDGTRNPPVVAGGGTTALTANSSPIPATQAALDFVSSIAVETAIDSAGARARYVYMTDAGTYVRRVDLSDGTMSTVAGGGSSFATSGKATNALIRPSKVALDYLGNLYIAAGLQCAIFRVETPPAITIQPQPGVPSSPTNSVPPDDPTPTENPQNTPNPGTNTQTNPGTNTQTTPGANTQTNPGTNTQTNTGADTGGATAPIQNETGILSNTQVQPQTQILDQGAAATPTPQATPTPTPQANAFVASPSPAPTPTPTPDAGGSTAAVVDQPSAAVVPPASAPVPPAASDVSPVAGSAPPPPGQQSVSNVGLAGTDADAVRGATRYAMVRSDEEGSAAAALSMALGGMAVAVFVCVLFIGPGASSQAKPRPKGAY